MKYKFLSKQVSTFFLSLLLPFLQELQVRKSYDCLHMHLHIIITIILHLQYSTLDIQGLLLNRTAYWHMASIHLP